jgi:uncharacterized repeat protein (TIGR01451 family)
VKKKSSSLARLAACFGLTALMSLAEGVAGASSLYVITDIRANPAPLNTYELQAEAPYLSSAVAHASHVNDFSALNVAIDPRSKTLFLTYENGSTFYAVNATTFDPVATVVVPRPEGEVTPSFAGIVFDQTKQRVYVAHRQTNHLYVYAWDAANQTLTQVGTSYVKLNGVSQAFGLALDETRGQLLVGDATTSTVRAYNTSDWAQARSYSIKGTTQTVMALAIDTQRHYLYTGNAYAGTSSEGQGSLGQLVRYDLSSEVAAPLIYTLPKAESGDNIVGLAVDEDTGRVYATTGNMGEGGTDTLLVFDQDLNVLKSDLGDLGNPTGLAILREYKPLNFSKAGPASVISGQNLTYELCYANPNEVGVSNVSITDTLPAGTSLVSATGPYSIVGSTLTWLVGNVSGGAPKTCYSVELKVNAAAGTQLVNSATITGSVGEGAVTDTQTVTTNVTADIIIVPESVSGPATVKGQGGGGSAGLIELLVGGGLLAATALRRRRATAARQAALLALAVTAAASAQAGSLANVYMGGGLGQAKAETSSQDMADDLVSRGYADAQVSLHNTHTGGKLFAGYQLNPFVAFETAYVDLGRTTSSTTATVDEAGKAKLAGDVSGVHPILIKGLGVSTVVRYPIGGFSVFSKLGLFNWTARAKAAFSPGGTPVTQSQFTGTDPSYGFGAAYDIPGTQLSLRGEWEHFATSRNDIKFVSMSLAYRF